MQGQTKEKKPMEEAKDAFDIEEYRDAIDWCIADLIFRRGAHDFEEDKLYRSSIYLDSLLKKNEKKCTIPELVSIKQMRINVYNLNSHPKTEPRLAECENPRKSIIKFNSVEILDNTVAEKNLMSNTNKMFADVNEAYFSDKEIKIDSSIASPSAITKLNSLWENKPFHIAVIEEIEGIIERTDVGWKMKGIPVYSGYNNNNEILIEYAEDGIITNIERRGLPEYLFEPEKIANTGSYTLDNTTHLNVIYEFLNRFYSAFENKELDFIKKVFSEYALIIHEKTVKYKIDKKGRKIKTYNTRTIEKDKKQYIYELERVFKKNKWVEVKFEDIKVIRSEIDTNLYGINFRQHWRSPLNYYESGFGWVYLDIDFNNPTEPVIWIKTWQPLETPSGRRYNLYSFPSFNRTKGSK
jgi:hypothetical protein